MIPKRYDSLGPPDANPPEPYRLLKLLKEVSGDRGFFAAPSVIPFRNRLNVNNLDLPLKERAHLKVLKVGSKFEGVTL